MRLPLFSRRGVPGAAAFLMATVGLWLAATPSAQARSCVWKVTSPDGHTLYLAGSVHALRKSDFPLPASYDAAYAASSRLAFETDLLGRDVGGALAKAATLPKGVTLRDRVDPRTYAYVRSVIGQVKGARTADEQELERLRPWALSFLLTHESVDGINTSYGVESYLIGKAMKDKKPTAGLVPFRQHIAVFGQMSDADSEMVLLHGFIHLDRQSEEYQRTVAAWRRGDAEAAAAGYDDAPSMRRRLLDERNLTWMPKIEGFLRSGKTWMVVAGAAHMAGPQGVPALLKAKGYTVEQL